LLLQALFEEGALARVPCGSGLSLDCGVAKWIWCDMGPALSLSSPVRSSALSQGLLALFVVTSTQVETPVLQLWRVVMAQWKRHMPRFLSTVRH